VSAERASKPCCVIEGNGKLRNGLFLRRIALYGDRIAFEVFASRPFRAEDLATLCLADDVGTKYEMAPLESGVIDGRARIEFTPTLPSGSQLHLRGPGWGLHTYGERAAQG
jgi:hypothetical protein